jgi:hypothetical protein
MTEKAKIFIHMVHGQQRTSYWTIHKHFTVTLQRNVVGGMAGACAGGGGDA